ncbi:succinate--CoA ligase subunit alpha [Blattabacterium cuenoti]|uniref:succinate--CoA ligase subunit alpha n=1 Tax=Blattabacterium cuenoti TaxID=1653831 RepID=UPI00163C5A32|nr:succinate--CoA ligase subunit alpha [Blattabacterium cuenoti]
MSILIDKNIRVIVQGMTGKEGMFHTEQMINYGTNIVGGVTPGKGGKNFMKIPIFNTVEDAVNKTGGFVSVIFVPFNYSFDAIVESIFSNINIIVCITEGIPVSDMIKIKYYLNNKKTILIGPNCPGIISPEKSKVGIMPNSIFKKKGNVGIISRSGTLTYEAADQIMKMGHSISTAIGVGGDSIIGTDIKYILKLFLQDSETDCIVIIGEIGGQQEIDAIKWMINEKIIIKKPIVGFIAGKTAPQGKIMGHAGAIIRKKIETAQVKMKILKKLGVHIVYSPDEIGITVNNIIKNNIKK